MILGNLVGALIIGWFFSWFGFDEIVIHGSKELFKLNITESGYYLIWAICGIVTGIFETYR